MKKNGSKKGGIIAIAVLAVIALAVNIACAALKPMITSWMGANLNPLITGSKAESSAEILSVAEATEQSLKMAEELENEGIVLLRNENSALPLANGSKINLFGFGSIDPIYGGTGSGSGDTSSNVDVVKGLENAGFTVNSELVDFYKNSGVSRPKQGGYTGSNFTPAEVPASAYTDAVLKQAKEFSDTAVIVLSRIGGEGGDLPQNMFAEGYSSTDDGRHYLELTQDEEDLLALVRAQGFSKTIVLINSSNTMELGFAEDGIDAVLWVGSPGAVGFNSVGAVLSGAVNPSGRLVDTYAYDLTSSPAYWNAGSFTYGNLKRNYVEYAEGIYVGYRYYETAAADGYIDYEKTVQYPFGYGLSYTTFTQSIESFVGNDNTVAMQVKVTNTGSVAGKDVVQVYYTAPYTKGGIEKAHVVLAGFGKTGLLEPNESETVTISFRTEDMASFDAFGTGNYVLEAGDYEIKLMKNAHDVIDSRSLTIAKTVAYGEGNARSTDKTAAVAHFADVQNGQITVYTSRSDWAGTTPKAREDGKTASDAVVKAFSEKAPYEVNASDPAIVYADNGLTLEDMAGLEWDDPKWELLLEQLSDEDMATMILNGGWSTPAVASVGKPATSDLDGPAGINSLVSSLRGVSFPSEVVIGSTWNEKLVEEFGKVFAQEAAANGVVGLYAPGMNIHRTPFSGRNFEYYSEDGFLSGKLGAAQVRGSESQGVYMYAKHFALNDQESNRLSISVWCNEQAMRELYLKPFELTVKEGGTTAIMSSYSCLGTTWAGASKALITDVLRGEWGFVGMVVTDSAMGNTSWMDPNLAVRAGNDMMLCLMGATIETDNNTARNAMRAACHNILYTQANSAAVQVEADNTPYWYALVALLNAVVLSAIVLILLRMLRKEKKNGWIGVLAVIGIFALSGLLVWFLAIKPEMKKSSGGDEPAETTPVEETTTAEPETTVPEPTQDDTTVSPEAGMELYELADFWLGCHVKINADNTFRVSYDYTEDAKDIEAETGTWERISDTELVLHAADKDIPVTLADGKWSCELTEANTGTVCHPSIEVGGSSVDPGPDQPEAVTYMIVYTDAEANVYGTVETTDDSVVPTIDVPVKEGYKFAGWQTRPVVTKEDLVLGVSPYEVPLGASSLYGGAGESIKDLESLSGTMLLLYARWVEPTEIHNVEDLKNMKDDLSGWYVLAEDIDLAGENWQPMGIYFSNYETVNAAYWTYAFRGTFDGAGHTIRNLTITMDGCKADLSAFEGVTPVWRNDGEALGSEAAFFGALANADIHDVTFEDPKITVTSDNDATPYAAVVGGFDIGSVLRNITVSGANVTVTAGDENTASRTSAWAAASAFIAGGWSDTIENCTVTKAVITLNGVTKKAHGGEFYVGSMLGEGYAFMNENTADAAISVDIRDESTALTDTAMIVNVGGMGGTNTTQKNGKYETTIDVKVNKPAGEAVVSVGGLAGSQRYQYAENNTIQAEITTDCMLDPAQGKLYVGSVIGSTNVPYCIVQMIFSAPDSIDYSGCRNNVTDVIHNGDAVTQAKGEVLTVNGEPLAYIANGDITDAGTGVIYASNIDAVIAEYGSAVPAAFLQKCAIVLIDE